ncbi:MAG: right-handed parallel beta-helix repeat-containing protein [Pseudomonadota bacterium]
MNKLKRIELGYGILGALMVFLLIWLFSSSNADAAQAWETDPNSHSKPTRQKTWRVACNRGMKLSRALSQARPGDLVRFSGRCMESIVIKHDWITLIGDQNAVIDGGDRASEAVVLVEGTRHVRLKNFAVQNGRDQGVLIRRSSHAKFSSLVMRNNATVGLAVDRSKLDMVNLAMERNGLGGMDAFANSTVVVEGENRATGNGGDGVAINGKSYIELRGAKLIATENRGSGLSVINDSRFQVLSFPEAQGSSVTANGNGFAGISILGSELSVVGSTFFGSGANVFTASNNLFGFFMPLGSIVSPHATAKFVAENNAVGMLMEDGARALIVGGLNLNANDIGVSADGAGTLNLVSVPPNPSSIRSNQLDLSLNFGSRVTIAGFDVNAVVCDNTVIVRGATCP